MPDVADRIRFIRQLDRDEFRSLTAVCDVMLAPFPFGAGDTSMEAFALGIPVVTLETDQLKGRFTAAMYRAMEIDECLAENVENHIAIATSLGTNAEQRRRVRDRILGRSSVLYENSGGVRDLESFLKSSCADC
jgi:protein O-GlcNAc transferase